MNTVIEVLNMNTAVGLTTTLVVATLLSSIVFLMVAKRQLRNCWIKKMQRRPVRSAHKAFFRNHP